MTFEINEPAWWLGLILAASAAGFFWSFGAWLFNRVARPKTG